jgi:hypothetical protein
MGRVFRHGPANRGHVEHFRLFWSQEPPRGFPQAVEDKIELVEFEGLSYTTERTEWEVDNLDQSP